MQWPTAPSKHDTCDRSYFVFFADPRARVSNVVRVPVHAWLTAGDNRTSESLANSIEEERLTSLLARRRAPTRGTYIIPCRS